MTQQEQELLKGLTDRVNGTTLHNKDEDAERTLHEALGSNPNALYVLCQTVLVQQFAMDNAQRQLTEARAEIARLQQDKPQEHGTFLGNLFGLGKGEDSKPQRQPAPPQGAPQGSGSGYAPVAVPPAGYAPAQPGYSQAPYAYGSAPAGGGLFGGSGGFMQGAMQTAAGVVAGEFAFKALENVFHDGSSSGRGFGDTEVVNNYYDNNADSSGGGFGDRLRDADGFSDDISSDIEDRRGESGFFGESDGGGDDFAASDNTDGDFGGDSGSDDSY